MNTNHITLSSGDGVSGFDAFHQGNAMNDLAADCDPMAEYDVTFPVRWYLRLMADGDSWLVSYPTREEAEAAFDRNQAYIRAGGDEHGPCTLSACNWAGHW